MKNKGILVCVCIFVVLFLGMVGYLVYFEMFEAKRIINNPYNKRQEILEETVVRGDILSSDGKILATTIVDSKGNEIRYYPYDNLLCHAVGYSKLGGAGIEAMGAYYLLSSNDNLWNQIMDDWSGNKHNGDSIITTLDVELSKAAYEALGDRKGSVIIMEPDTGRILTMISNPSYNPNTIEDDWDNIVKDTSNAPLLNRATKGLYPPGSIFKLVTLLSYYKQYPDTYSEYSYECDGSYEINNTQITCSHNNAHNMQDINMAFANSCNGAFVDMGLKLNVSEYKKTAEQLFFNKKIPFKEECAISQFVLSEESSEWEIAQTSFGQGQTLVTPIHMLMLYSSVANDGIVMEPYMIEGVISKNGKEIHHFSPQKNGRIMTIEEAKLLKNNLNEVIEVSFDWLFGESEYSLLGKSGTAQYGTNGMEHSWFVSCSPSESPQIAVCVIVEESNIQNITAVEVTKKIYDYYYSR